MHGVIVDGWMDVVMFVLLNLRGCIRSYSLRQNVFGTTVLYFLLFLVASRPSKLFLVLGGFQASQGFQNFPARVQKPAWAKEIFRPLTFKH